MRKILAEALLVICTAGSFTFLFIQPETETETFFWQDFAKQEFMQGLGEKTLMLKFTADWCPTCKVLENTVFSNKNKEELARIFSDDVRFILVDMTQFSEEKQKTFDFSRKREHTAFGGFSQKKIRISPSLSGIFIRSAQFKRLCKKPVQNKPCKKEQKN